MLTLSPNRALVLFSGGQDSTVCLAWALNTFDEVETIGFDYGQRHNVEMICRERIRDRLFADFAPLAKKLGTDHVIDIASFGAIGETALTRETEIAFGADSLPTTFVPARNFVFLTYAAALAYRRGMGALVGGMCETDYSGYPDCRDAALQTLASALKLGLEADLEIKTPLMFLDKAETWGLAEQIGGEALVDLIVKETHTCYLGARDALHDWGYGCGECPACDLRAKGYRAFRAG